MTLEEIWKGYNYPGGPDSDKNPYWYEDKLAKEIERHTRTVLSFWLKVDPTRHDYEDLMQEGAVCFFEIVETFDPKKGNLEKYFMFNFYRRAFKLLKKDPLWGIEGDVLYDVSDEVVEVSDIEERLLGSLTDDEITLYNFIQAGISSETGLVAAINYYFGVNETALIKKRLNFLRRKVTKLLLGE